MQGREFTIIPPNFPHTTTSDVGNISKWEYLFIDAEGFLQVAAWNAPQGRKNDPAYLFKSTLPERPEYKSLSNKIIKILEIMRASDEFYLEEAKGVLLATCGSGQDEPVPLRKKILRKKEKSPI